MLARPVEITKNYSYANIPNALSVSRIVFAGLIVIMSGHLTTRTYIATVSMLITAMITDGFDGYLARRWGTSSDLGYVLDTMGDRAIHLALVLVFLVRYAFNPVFVWLLIFRDIAIYAVRIMSRNWLYKSKQMRPVFLFHTTCLRVWLGLYLLRDGIRIFMHADVFDSAAFEMVQMTLLLITIIVSYYGLARSINWIIDQEHETL